MRGYFCNRSASIPFWDGYARWYKLWLNHNHYHNEIIKILASMIKPGWKAVDIGAGNGIFSLPISAFGCDVTALEPSVGMRNLLYAEAFKRGIDYLRVDERIWEEVPCYEFLDYDLIMTCNTLHLTQIGFDEAIAKTFRARPANVFLILEAGSPEIRVKWRYGDYTMVFTKSYETDSSYAYHHLDEMVDHWTFKRGRTLKHDEICALKKRIVLQDGHLWMKDLAQVMMYWWRRNGKRKFRNQFQVLCADDASHYR
jgi:ubiquinone/menaquinone biosynthesis C-methylase UbiE